MFQSVNNVISVVRCIATNVFLFIFPLSVVSNFIQICSISYALRWFHLKSTILRTLSSRNSLIVSQVCKCMRVYYELFVTQTNKCVINFILFLYRAVVSIELAQKQTLFKTKDPYEFLSSDEYDFEWNTGQEGWALHSTGFHLTCPFGGKCSLFGVIYSRDCGKALLCEWNCFILLCRWIVGINRSEVEIIINE